MKIKLIAVTALVLALGINTTQAQNRQGKREENQIERQDRNHDGFSKDRGRDNTRSYGNDQRGDRNSRYGNTRKSRHRNEFRRHDRHDRRSSFHKRHNRRHSF